MPVVCMHITSLGMVFIDSDDRPFTMEHGRFLFCIRSVAPRDWICSTFFEALVRWRGGIFG